MEAELYEFSKTVQGKGEKYIFQQVYGRRLSDVYHSHDFYELIWFLSGDGRQIVNERPRRFSAGEALLLRPGDRHCFTDQSADARVISLSVECGEMELVAASYDPRLVALVTRGEPVYFPATGRFFPYVGGIDGWEGVDEYDCKLLLSCLLRAYLDHTGILDERPTMPAALSHAAEEMRRTENLRDGLSAFMRLSHYSESQLARLTKQHLGMSPKRYVNELRLAAAYREIILTKRPIESVAEELGFMSFSHFNKIFTARYSVTPAALRRGRGIFTA